MQWMNDSVAGVYDLVKGFKDAGKAAYKVLTLFSTKSGSNGLQDFADAMDKLNKRLEKVRSLELWQRFGIISVKTLTKGN